jgi:uronate dehydrogenase
LSGIDVVVHLAAETEPLAPFQRVLRNNIKATWNVVEAAATHQVPRVVFASSNWAVKALEARMAPACYLSQGPKIDSGAPPAPFTGYGLSKAMGELTGKMFVDGGELCSFIAVRIGLYDPQPPGEEEFRTRWIGTDDIRSLFRRCVEAEINGFHVVYGVSAQPNAPYDLSHTSRLLDWKPKQLP